MRKGDLFAYDLYRKKLILSYVESGQLVSERFVFGEAEDPDHDFRMRIAAQFTDDIAYVMTLWNPHDVAKSISIDISIGCVTDELETMARHQRQSPTPIPIARYKRSIQPSAGLN